MPTPSSRWTPPKLIDMMTTLQVIVAFLEMEHAVRAVAESDDASKRLSTQLAALCQSHHDLLLGILSCKREVLPLKGCGTAGDAALSDHPAVKKR
jgi:hypothetical protein